MFIRETLFQVSIRKAFLLGFIRETIFLRSERWHVFTRNVIRSGSDRYATWPPGKVYFGSNKFIKWLSKIIFGYICNVSATCHHFKIQKYFWWLWKVLSDASGVTVHTSEKTVSGPEESCRRPGILSTNPWLNVSRVSATSSLFSLSLTIYTSFWIRIRIFLEFFLCSCMFHEVEDFQQHPLCVFEAKCLYFPNQ